MTSSNLAVSKIGTIGSQQPMGVREMASAGMGLGEELSNAKRIQRMWRPERSLKWRPPGWAQTEKGVLASVPLGWKGSEMQL